MLLSGFKNNRFGQIDNYMAVIIFLVIFGFTIIMATLLHSGIITAFTDAGIYTGVLAETGAKFHKVLLLHDTIIVIALALLIVGVGITSYRLNAAPAFFIITLFMGVFFGFISYFFNYIFAQLVSDAAFATTIVLFPNTMIVCTNLHWVALVLLIVGSITLYAKKEVGGPIR